MVDEEKNKMKKEEKEKEKKKGKKKITKKDEVKKQGRNLRSAQTLDMVNHKLIKTCKANELK
jgi:hypothetical protein